MKRRAFLSTCAATLAVRESRERNYHQALFVGRPVPEIEFSIEPESIWVAGRHVCPRYIGNEEANRLYKWTDDEGRIWHRMGDLGSIDARGRVWFAGRKAERVLTIDGPLFTDPIEARYLGRPGVPRCALVGVGERGSELPVLVIEGEADASVARTIVDEGHVKHVLFHKSFPVDVRHNAKIHRHTLKRWAEKQLGGKH